MITILLVDDDTNIRRGIRMHLALEADLAVVGEAADGWEALRLAADLRPDVVVMDIRLPGLDGLTATAQIRRTMPDCAVVILSLYDDPQNLALATQAGAADFVSKHSANGRLVQAIRAAVSQ